MTVRTRGARLSAAALMVLLAACRGEAGDPSNRAGNGPGADSGSASGAPAFASSGSAPDEGTVQPVAGQPAKPLRIAILGMENSPFWIDVKAGVDRARTELAAHNTTVEWIVAGDVHTADVFGRAIDAAVAKQYDAIATIAGDAGVAAFIDRAVEAGVPVATFNSETDTPNRRLFFVGADSYLQGKAAGRKLCEAIGGKGKVAAITGFFAVEAHALRLKGIEDELKASCPGAEIVGRVEDSDKAEVAYQQAKDFMTAHRDLAGMVVTAGGNFGAARAIEEAGLGGRLKLVTFDMIPEIMEYVNKGVVVATVGQNPDAQGHDPAVRLYNYLVGKQVPPFARLVTRADVITKENAAQFTVKR